MLGLALFPSSFSSSSSSFPPPTQQTTAASCVLSSLHLLFSQHLERSRSPHSDLGLTALTHQHWLVWSLPSVLQEGTRTEQPGEAAGSWGLGAPSEESPSRMRCFPVGFFLGAIALCCACVHPPSFHCSGGRGFVPGHLVAPVPPPSLWPGARPMVGLRPANPMLRALSMAGEDVALFFGTGSEPREGVAAKPWRRRAGGSSMAAQ